MASSRSFSCSSWGDCCVVGWEEKRKPNQTEFNYLSEAVYNWTKPVFPHFRTHSKWHCSVSTRGLSEVVVWHVTGKARVPGTNLREVTGALSTTAPWTAKPWGQSRASFSSPTFRGQESSASIWEAKLQENAETQLCWEEALLLLLSTEPQSSAQTTQCNCTDAFCAHKSQVLNCYLSHTIPFSTGFR